jgi:hypothetical protein
MTENIQLALSPSYIEHDAFLMFSRLMTVLAAWFETGPERPPIREKQPSVDFGLFY